MAYVAIVVPVWARLFHSLRIEAAEGHAAKFIPNADDSVTAGVIKAATTIQVGKYAV